MKNKFIHLRFFYFYTTLYCIWNIYSFSEEKKKKKTFYVENKSVII